MALCNNDKLIYAVSALLCKISIDAPIVNKYREEIT